MFVIGYVLIAIFFFIWFFTGKNIFLYIAYALVAISVTIVLTFNISRDIHVKNYINDQYKYKIEKTYVNDTLIKVDTIIYDKKYYEE